MTIYSAFITHRTKHHSACESLTETLARIPELCTQTWTQKRIYPNEEQLPKNTGINALLLRLLGAHNPQDMSVPLARQSTLGQSLDAMDIIHLSQIRGDTLSLMSLSKLQQPVLCELSDDYPLTALCSHSNACQQYRYHCRNCPRCMFPNLVERLFHYKKACFNAIKKLIIITPSHKRQHEVSNSPMFQGREVRHIGIAVNCKELCAQNRIASKVEHDIHPHQRVIAFRCSGKQADWEQYEKDIITDICQQLHEEGYLALHILILGKNNAPALPYPCSCYTGAKEPEQKKANLYSCIDILIHLSTKDCDERHALEAMACQVPIITHRWGNMSEYVTHQNCGYSIRGKLELNIDKILHGIKHLLHAPVLRTHYGLHARQYIEQEHEADFIAQLYRQLYQEQISNANPHVAARGEKAGA